MPSILLRPNQLKAAVGLAAIAAGSAYSAYVYGDCFAPPEEKPQHKNFRLKRRLPTIFRMAECSALHESQPLSSFQRMYDMGEKLGTGAYAVVHICLNKKSKKPAAVKVFNRRKLTKQSEATIREEVDILKSLKHPNIVQLFDVFEDPNYFYLVMEICRGGELFDRIVAKSYYTEKEARDVIRILLNALAYVHEANVVHRDLKPENLLLATPNDDRNIKIADFGLSARVPSRSGMTSGLTQYCGTPGYTAPEILQGKRYGQSVDMWSAGIIIYILLGGYPPFGDDEKQMIKGNYEFHSPEWDHVSEDAKDLIRKMLVVDPRKRITAREALKHRWVQAEDEVLANRSLSATKEQLARFNAKRKFRAAVDAVMVANKMKRNFTHKD